MPSLARPRFALAIALVLALQPVPAPASEPVDYLSFARGAVPIAVGGAAADLRVGMEQAMRAIDGDDSGYGATPKPGSADTEIWFVYRLPAATTFTQFFVPEVGETPSPSQTFFREVEIAGSDVGPDGPFERLGAAALATHAEPGQRTRIAAVVEKPVRWVKLTLRGGIRIERDATFLEFSEIVGEGRQAPVPMLEAFTGKWSGRGVKLELVQDGAAVTGCYDGEGDLEGTVTGHLLHATGRHRSSGVPSAFVLTVTDGGGISGVRSTNGAPFRLYAGEPDAKLVTECAARARPPGCGDAVHGILFDYDSAAIREESGPVLDALYAGLAGSQASAITIVGHTSSEGSEAYNLDLSQRRAEAVVTALVERGIDRARLAAGGAGEARPIAENATETGRSLNRRVEIECSE